MILSGIQLKLKVQNMNNYVSLEMSKRISHLFPDAEYWWLLEWSQEPMIVKKLYAEKYLNDHNSDLKVPEDLSKHPAVSIAELLDRLPDYLNNRGQMLTIVKNILGEWWVSYPDNEGKCPCGFAIVKKELPDALAEVLEHLDKNNLLGGDKK